LFLALGVELRVIFALLLGGLGGVLLDLGGHSKLSCFFTKR
jgi:hypothetical protein